LPALAWTICELRDFFRTQANVLVLFLFDDRFLHIVSRLAGGPPHQRLKLCLWQFIRPFHERRMSIEAEENFTFCAVQRSKWLVSEKSVSPRNSISLKAPSHSVMALSHHSAAPVWLGTRVQCAVVQNWPAACDISPAKLRRN